MHSHLSSETHVTDLLKKKNKKLQALSRLIMRNYPKNQKMMKAFIWSQISCCRSARMFRSKKMNHKITYISEPYEWYLGTRFFILIS